MQFVLYKYSIVRYIDEKRSIIYASNITQLFISTRSFYTTLFILILFITFLKLDFKKIYQVVLAKSNSRTLLSKQVLSNSHSEVNALETKYSKNGPSKIFGSQSLKTLKGYGVLNRPYPLKFSKGCLPQNLLIPLLNTLSHLYSTVS